jgi:threonine dehydrogenase-like Zn-dependent dehydrogenase
VKALVFERSLPRFAAARVVSSFGSGRGAGVGPLRLVEEEAPPLPGEGWHAVTPLLSGICGSDLATLDGRSSRYFENLVSFPFVPGHEVVGTVGAGARAASGQILEEGTRVVLEPVLGCLARGIEPVCTNCATGRLGDCENVAFGHLRPGLQTGFCTDTGGGWSQAGLVAHESQLHPVPDDLDDQSAVTVEPLACAIHAALSADVHEGDTVAVIGAGMLGLGVTAALSHLGRRGFLPEPAALLVGAKYSHQQNLAEDLGATQSMSPDQLGRAVRRRSRSLVVGGPSLRPPRLSGGADVVFDCVGSASSIEQSLDMVRPRGMVILVGMPGRARIDLAPLWHREVALIGAYAYGVERVRAEHGATRELRTFDLAMEVAASARTGRLVSATYPLERFEEAIAHAGNAGRRRAVKITFDLTASAPRPEARRPTKESTR